MAGLHDELRPGRPRSHGDEAVARLINRVLHSSPKGATHWSVRAVAAQISCPASVSTSTSRSRPTNLVSPRPAARCSGVRSGPRPITSYTLTASLTPLTLVRPSGLKVKYPSQSLRIASVTAIGPGGASACIRAAKPVEWPIGVYSTWPSPVAIERTTTSPVFTPTRASIGRLPAALSFVE